ncbi:MAG: 4Fe-4S binding protein, partial [Candidatus Cloacimonetes bacterium]|nr:4Fe-4S binding protein [Candidatus Cloacimonadota bacterium]
MQRIIMIKKNLEKCIYCERCDMLCPDYAMI